MQNHFLYYLTLNWALNSSYFIFFQVHRDFSIMKIINQSLCFKNCFGPEIFQNKNTRAH